MSAEVKITENEDGTKRTKDERLSQCKETKVRPIVINTVLRPFFSMPNDRLKIRR